MSVNKVILVGNLGTSPELRSSEKKKSVCSFSVATNHLFKDAQQEKRTRTEWHQIVCFGETAQNCAQYLTKGRQVYVEGRIQSQKWKDNEGKDRYTNRVVANTVQFLGPRPAKPAEEPSVEHAPESIMELEEIDDDDIPF